MDWMESAFSNRHEIEIIIGILTYPKLKLVESVSPVYLCAAFCASRVRVQTERPNVQKQSADHEFIRVHTNIFNSLLTCIRSMKKLVFPKCLIFVKKPKSLSPFKSIIL